MKKKFDSPLTIIPLGGCGEFGMNMTCYSLNNKFIVVDAGILFPEPQALGVNCIIPDVYKWFKKFGKLCAYVITHGHEDHIGALPHIIKEHPAPIYATPWSAELIRQKIHDTDFTNFDLKVISTNDSFDCHPFSIKTIPVNHSIPDACALYIEAGGTKVFHTGDFKIESNPDRLEKVDFGQLRKIGKKGVDLMLSDSTNAAQKGFSGNESDVIKPLEKIFKNAPGRIFITTFASNFYRLKNIVELCHKLKKKVYLQGRGIKKSVEAGIKLGKLDPNDKLFITHASKSQLQNKNLVIIISGSQGEEQSNLTRLAMGKLRNFSIKKNDTVIYSSKKIPGNEVPIIHVIDSLKKQGALIETTKDNPNIHVSGHAYAGEISKLVKALEPKYFIPVHGTHSLLVENAAVAKKAYPQTRTRLIENGDVLEHDTPKGLQIKKKYSIDRVFIDKDSNMKISKENLQQRLDIGEVGLVLVSGILSNAKSKWLKDPKLETKGIPFPWKVNEKQWFQNLEGELKLELNRVMAIEDHFNQKVLRQKSQQILARIFNNYLGKKPVIVSQIFLV